MKEAKYFIESESEIEKAFRPKDVLRFAKTTQEHCNVYKFLCSLNPPEPVGDSTLEEIKEMRDDCEYELYLLTRKWKRLFESFGYNVEFGFTANEPEVKIIL